MRFMIKSQYIGDAQPVFIVAEIGINHQGDPEIARKLIRCASLAGANAVKFQKRTLEKALTRSMLDAPYESIHSFGRTYGEHRQRLELSTEVYCDLKQYAETEGLLFFASAWDEQSADTLEELAVPLFKIASADITNLPLLEHIARKQIPLLISTGMSTLEEVDLAVQTVRKYTDEFVLLQCTSAYPAASNELHLQVIPMFRERYHCSTGYSGHESGTGPSLAAVALGACVIERHLTLDKHMKGSDHRTSLDPLEFQHLVQSIRQIEEALGKPEKRVWPSEVKNREKLSKSVVSACYLKHGTVLQPEMVAFKSPGTGISPSRLSDLIGRVILRDIPQDTLIQEEYLTRVPSYSSNFSRASS